MDKPMTRRAFMSITLTEDVDGSKLQRSEEEWRNLLSPLQFRVMRVG